MIGSRIGSKAALYGSAVGSVTDDEGPVSGIAGVSRDLVSGIYVPASAAEWTLLMAAAGLATGNPSSLWLCQEAAGNLADSIGSLTLVAGGTAATYRTAVPGMTRLSVAMASAATTNFSAAAGSGPDPSTTSSLWIWYAYHSTPGASRTMYTAGGATNLVDATIGISSAGKVTIRDVNVTANSVATQPTLAISPWALRYDRTHSVVGAYTNADKILGTYNSGVTDGPKGISSASDGPPNFRTAYGVMFQGAAAEITDAQLKTLLTTLGWTIPWS